MKVGSYFKPVRRKFGIVALLLALVLAGGWLRSLTAVDVLCVSHPVLLTLPQTIVVFDLLRVNNSGQSYTGWRSCLSAKPNLRDDIQDENNSILWSYRYCGIGLGTLRNGVIRPLTERNGSMTITFVTEGTILCWIPYWSIVLPLTLVSAWLLISKPRSIETAAIRQSES